MLLKRLYMMHWLKKLMLLILVNLATTVAFSNVKNKIPHVRTLVKKG